MGVIRAAPMTGFFDFDRVPRASREQFERFHRANPEIYQRFIFYTMEAIRAGREHYSARTIVERIRWHTSIETNDPDFKINDHCCPFYSRLFEDDHPDHRGFFKMRRSVADVEAGRK